MPGKHIALNESHSAFSRDLSPAPGGGEVKYRDQPRMRDESTAASTDGSNTASPGLDAAEPLTPAEQVVVSGVRAADPAHEDSGRTEPPCGEMRIRTDSAASAASLADYLRRCECLVEVIDGRIIDATVRPQSLAAPHQDVELEGYLTVWQAMHPESLIERLTPLAPG